jgi:acetolactate synthase-1/2/3 large subunit
MVAGPADDLGAALDALSDLLGSAQGHSLRAERRRPPLPSGDLDASAVAQALGHLLPEGAIISDEGNSSSIFAPGATAGAPPHDWLSLTGGSIGQGLPVAAGAAIADPSRRVIALEADGSALYTLQALWTMAREGLDVTTIILANRSYAVLNMELDRVGAAAPGPRARAMLDLTGPTMDFVSLATGFGLLASRATTAEDFATQLARALSEPGPSLIEAVIPSLL